jgi:uncharacterized RDD family membrane protein YckC
MDKSTQLIKASAGRRIVAFGWDYGLIASYGVGLLGLSLLAQRILVDVVEMRMSGPWFFDLLAFSVLVWPVLLYFALSEASRHGATWGKRRVGIRVVTLAGGSMPLGRSLARSALKFLPWQIAHTSLLHIPGWPLAAAVPWYAALGFGLSFLLVGLYLWGLRSSRRRTLYDVTAGSQVVVVTGSRAEIKRS